VTALWKDGHLRRLELQPLSRDETTTLVEATLGGPVGSVTARRLWAITRGNALYLRQLVDAELESSRLRQVAGCGNGRASRSCHRGWWSWCGRGSVSCRTRNVTSSRCWRSASRWAYRWLVVSVRTVEGHLYRASTKLGVTNRAQLADSLGAE